MRRQTVLKAGAVACAVALLGSLSACGGSKKSTTTADGKPIVTVLVKKNANQEKMANMQWAKDLEADCDCKIEWQEVTREAWAQQKNATLASGDIADVNLNGYGAVEAYQYPGMFEDLSKDLDKLPNVKAFFKQKPDAKKLITDPDGHIYALPSSRGKSYSGSGQNMMINKAWLDKLGLQVPTTWDELENVLKAFKTQDPNGNGQADEIPMNIKKLEGSYFTWYSPMLLLNSTGIVTGFNKGVSEYGFYAKNGVVKSFLTSDEYKEVIKYYHKLISEGLIPAEWATKDDDAYNADQISDGKTAKTGVVFGWSPSDNFGKLKDQYIAMPVPSAPGVSPDQTVWDGSSSELSPAGLSISSHAANKDAALKLANLLYSEKYSVQQFLGSFGKAITKTGEHEYTVDNDKLSQLTGDNQYPGLSELLVGWIPDEATIKGDTHADELIEVNKVYEEQRSHFDPVKDYIPDYVNMDNMDPSDSAKLSTSNAEINNTVMQKTAAWMAKGGIDEEWDAYCKQLDSIGLQDNIKIWQKWYDTYTK